MCRQIRLQMLRLLRSLLDAIKEYVLVQINKGGSEADVFEPVSVPLLLPLQCEVRGQAVRRRNHGQHKLRGFMKSGALEIMQQGNMNTYLRCLCGFALLLTVIPSVLCSTGGTHIVSECLYENHRNHLQDYNFLKIHLFRIFYPIEGGS